jgi:signal transduction histidine kinase/ligand-binding sensor domain-containing protein
MMPSARVPSLLLLLILSTGLRAQTFFEHLTRADGLPGDQVLALHEDREGFIWIGTESGLARHEGVRIHTWYHDRKDPRSLPNNTVWDITEDASGRVWIATDHGLCGYDARSGGFDRIFITKAYVDPTSANRIHRVRDDGQGLLWLSTEDGVHTVSLEGGPHEVPLPDGGERIARLTNGAKAMGLVVDTARHGLWIDTPKGVLFRDSRSHAYRTADAPGAAFACLNDPKAQCATPDGSGGIWYFTMATRELRHMNAEWAQLASYPVTAPGRDLPSPQFLALDRKGRLWMSTWGHELWLLDIATGRWTTIAPDPDIPWSITSSNAKSWLEDRAGRIWIGTYEGLNVIDPAHADLAPYPIGRAEVSSIAAMDARYVLLGTAGEGVVLLDRANGAKRTMRYGGIPEDPTLSEWANYPICFAHDKIGWLTGTHCGMYRVDTAAAKLEPFPNDHALTGSVQRATIRFMAQDGKGQLWIGTHRKGLYRTEVDGSLAHCDSFAGVPFPSRELLSCVVGPDGLWMGFNNGAGLCRIQNDRIAQRALDLPDSTGTNYGVVPALARENNGTLYIGTLMGGLGVRDPGTGLVTWYTRSDGLSGDRIEQLVTDHGSGLWIRTDGGLCRFDRSTHVIDRVDPPAPMRSLGPLGAIALDVDGSLLCAYGPLLLDRPTTPVAPDNAPDVQATSLRFAGQALAKWSPDSTIELRHDARALTIEFGTSSFFSGQAVRFAYRIADIDSNWRNLGSTARLDLNDLPVGDHRLQVRANNGGSAWTKAPLSLSVRVLPPFWSTWWFRGALLLGIGAALYFFLRGYVNERLREQRERLEREQAVLAERMRIAGDMHDDLGAGLSALKLRSEMALRVEKDPVKREQLGALAHTAGDLIGSMRQIIWTMNTDQSSLADLVSYTTNYTRSYCEQNGLTPEIITVKEWPTVQLTSEQRRNTFLVVKEALHNVVKHANARTVRLAMSHGDSHLLVDVQDDGVGLPGHTQDSVGNGLRNMRKRILALGGTLGTESSMGLPGDLLGTRIRFRVPLERSDSNKGSIGVSDIAADIRPR